ncbi:MAG: serine hydrolase domain-containing protein [Vicinamibacterales bacterium]
MKTLHYLRLCLVVVLTAALAPRSLVAALPANLEAEVDKIFAKWSRSTPGCAVGVSIGGRPALMKAYGMADLEHDVPNTPETIFEAGSVAKQFTAMAVLLLAKDGKLSLDDAVRNYIPELPDYGASAAARDQAQPSSGETSPKPLRGEGGPLTIRHMLTHTSGLRDWGSVASIAGWPRTTREYTHAHVLDIASRQRSLNFPSGTKWSYSNTGFNLAAIIVERVSGMPFAEFSRQRIFSPLGMSHTSWRDDHTRIVKGRAIAYSEDNKVLHTEMPFENVHGNGGLLTTVGDLLKWNENSVRPTVGTPQLIAEQQRAAHTTDGKELNYALGLYVGQYRGVPSVWHSGSTAGYRAHLSRYPDAHTSVAVLCNVSSGDATRANNNVAAIVLADRLKPAPPTPPAPRPPTAMSPPPAAATLSELVGSYWSDEAEVMITMRVENGQLIALRRPDSNIALTPTAPDTFRGASLGTLTFRRDAAGRVNAFSVTQERVWDLRFERK